MNDDVKIEWFEEPSDTQDKLQMPLPIQFVQCNPVPPLAPMVNEKRDPKTYRTVNMELTPKPPVPPLIKINSNNEANSSTTTSLHFRSMNVNQIPPVMENSSMTVLSNTQVIQNVQYISQKSRPEEKVLQLVKDNKIYRLAIPPNILPAMNESSKPLTIKIPDVGSIIVDPNNLLAENVIHIDDMKKRQQTMFSKNIKIPLQVQMKRKIAKICSIETKNAGLKSILKKPGSDFVKIKLPPKKNGFSGFEKEEIMNAKKRLRKYNLIINKQNTILSSKIRDYFILRNRICKKIISKPSPSLRRLSKSCNYYSSNSNQNLNVDNDLLLTKKVVLVEEENGVYKKKTSKTCEALWQERAKIPLFKYNKIRVKPCYVDMEQNEIIETIAKTKLFSKNGCIAISLQWKSGKLEKAAEVKETPREKSEDVIETGYMKLQNKNTNQGKKRLNFDIAINEKMFLKNLVLSKALLKGIIDPNKPILLVNEFNIHTLKFSVVSKRVNVVFAVKEDKAFPDHLLWNSYFVNAVSNKYIRLVDSKLIFSFLQENH